jgi:hypothetical protein
MTGDKNQKPDELSEQEAWEKHREEQRLNLRVRGLKPKPSPPPKEPPKEGQG